MSGSLEKLLRKDKSPIIMGVCNITPDSFSDGGKYLDKSSAQNQTKLLFDSGSHVVDIGAESTGPGSIAISEDEEIERLGRVVQEISNLGIISVDTYKSKVAEVLVKQGASIINDVSALRADKKMPEVVASSGCYVVLMYNSSGNAENSYLPHVSKDKNKINFKDVVKEIINFLEERVEFSLSSGILANKIILDPGMGAFISYDSKYSWEVLERFKEITTYFKDFPVMIASSRKGFLGVSLEKRDSLSQLTALHAVKSGAKIIRTHAPEMAKDFLTADKKLFPER